MYVFMYVCVSVFIYIHTHTHTHTQTNSVEDKSMDADLGRMPVTHTQTKNNT